MKLALSGISLLLMSSTLCLTANEESPFAENSTSHDAAGLIAQSSSARSQNSYAEEQEPTLQQYDERIQIGGNYTYAWITPDGNNTTKGSLGGGQAIYEYRPLNSLYMGAAFAYRIGKTTNDTTTRKLQDFHPQLRIGYTFANADVIDRLALFTGFGARYMAEDVSVGSASLDFDYTTFYVPVGLALEKFVVDHFIVGLNFQWMPQVLPMVRIDLLDGAQWDLTYQLVNFFVEVPLICSLCDDRFTISFSPFFEIWKDGRSTAETLTDLTLSLPGNRYLFAGLNLNFGFCF